MDLAAYRATLYRTVWRWHFYAGLFVMPFILLLSVTGAIYLFKPQLDRWEERAYRGLPSAHAVSPVAQVEAALAATPGARLSSYRVPVERGDAALVHVSLPDGAMRDVFVAPQGGVIAQTDPEQKVSAIVSRIHGNLLIGRVGDWLVELAASWAIVMVLTGLYLWWPRGRGLAGVIWPRRRAGLRDLHAVTGFWISGLVLAMLASGLPWAGVWGTSLKLVRTELGMTRGRPEWKVGAAATMSAEHAGHDHVAMAHDAPASPSLALLPVMVTHARAEALVFPASVVPPGTPQRFGPAAPGWTVKSEAQNRTLARTITYDARDGRELARSGFADKHPIDRLVGYGISWHEGQLIPGLNQLIGLLTALALIGMVVTSFMLWRRRRPGGLLGAPPPPPPREAAARGVAVIVVLLCLVLPLLALSMVAVLLLEWLVLRRFSAAAAWLGLRAASA